MSDPSKGKAYWEQHHQANEKLKKENAERHNRPLSDVELGALSALVDTYSIVAQSPPGTPRAFSEEGETARQRLRTELVQRGILKGVSDRDDRY